MKNKAKMTNPDALLLMLLVAWCLPNLLPSRLPPGHPAPPGPAKPVGKGGALGLSEIPVASGFAVLGVGGRSSKDALALGVLGNGGDVDPGPGSNTSPGGRLVVAVAKLECASLSRLGEGERDRFGTGGIVSPPPPPPPAPIWSLGRRSRDFFAPADFKGPGEAAEMSSESCRRGRFDVVIPRDVARPGGYGCA